ncbi:hypothetical protein V1511DRAFT_455452 [Dipodascopsis uninucleata]
MQAQEIATIGSDHWIRSEIQEIQSLVLSTYHDFAYAAQDELDWMDSRVSCMLLSLQRYVYLFVYAIPYSFSENQAELQIPMHNNITVKSSEDTPGKENANPLSSHSADPLSRCSEHALSLSTDQVILPAVSEFYTDPIVQDSSSDIADGDAAASHQREFFGKAEREILNIKSPQTHSSSPSKHISRQSVISSSTDEDIDVEMTDPDISSSDTGTAVDSSTVDGMSLEINERDISNAGLAADIVANTPSGANNIHLSGSTLESALKTDVNMEQTTSGTSRQATPEIDSKGSLNRTSIQSFYSADDEDPRQDSDLSRVSPFCTKSSNTSPVTAFPGSVPPVAQGTPQSPSRFGKNTAVLSPSRQPAIASPISPSQFRLYPAVPSPHCIRSPPVQNKKLPPTSVSTSPTSRDTHTTTIPVKESDDTSYASHSSDTSNTFASLPAKAPLTTKKSLGKRISGVSSSKSSIGSRKTLDSEDDREIESELKYPDSGLIISSAATPYEAKADNSLNEKKVTVENATQTKKSMIPSLPSYSNLNVMMADSQDEEEEDWIPLSKATPAPKSRLMPSVALDAMASAVARPQREKPVAEKDQVLEEEDTENGQDASSDKDPNLFQKMEKKAEVATSKTIVVQDKEKKGYLSNTLASASRSKIPMSPTRSSVPRLASPTRPPRRPVSPVRSVAVHKPQLSVGNSTALASTLRATSPVRAHSPLRTTVNASRPQSPTRSVSSCSTSSEESIQQPTRTVPSSPVRKIASEANVRGASPLRNATAAVSTSALANSAKSPVTTALKSMKSSTTDMFRKARLLLFETSPDQREATTQTIKSGSPIKRTSQDELRKDAAPGRSMYPDISDLGSNNTRDANRSPTRMNRVNDTSNYFKTSAAGGINGNPAKVLFPANTVKPPGSIQPLASSNKPLQSQNNEQANSNRKTEIFYDCDSGDLHLSPDAQETQNIKTSTGTQASNSAYHSHSSSTGNATLNKQVTTKRVKSAIRKPPVRTKQAPVVVRVPMGAQRELEQQRKIAAAAAVTTNIPISGAMQLPEAEMQTLPPQPTSQHQIQQLLPSKERDEEDRSKSDPKREIERRRQENVRRAQLQAEERKRQAEEEEARRKLASARTSRVPHSRQGLRSEVLEDNSRTTKRNIPAEADNNRLKVSRTSVTADQSKRRRTGELPLSPPENGIRPSSIRVKDCASVRSVISSGQQHTSQSLMKTAITHQARNMPFVEGVKFSSDKIRFGGVADSASVRTMNSATGTHNNSASSVTYHSATPGGQNNHAASSHSSQFRLSQITQIQVNSGDHIVLPEIYSESEDDDDDSVIQDWAHSPMLQDTLRRQQQIDPDSIFGPVAPLQMEEVFRTRGGPPARFRPRSSSANWSSGDKLTAQEIESYAAEMGYENAGSGSNPKS